ncbi:MAG: hypothetical protein AAFR65_13130 [Pseudomonadota bacterium]
MRVLRLIALSFWLITSAANAAVNHDLCDHPGMGDGASMDHAMMGGDSQDPGEGQHHDGCCDGVCLCGTLISTGLSPTAPSFDQPQLTASVVLPGADEASELIETFDLPPPRLG